MTIVSFDPLLGIFLGFFFATEETRFNTPSLCSDALSLQLEIFLVLAGANSRVSLALI